MSKTPVKPDYPMMIAQITEKLETETRPEIRARYEAKLAEWKEYMERAGLARLEAAIHMLETSFTDTVPYETG
jgi:hypothetical protein